MVAKFLHDHLPPSIADRWPLDRIIEDMLIVLVVILGWLVVDQRQANEKTISCVRDFLVTQSQSSQPRTEANAKKDDALAKAVDSLSPLIHRFAEAAQRPDEKPTAKQNQEDISLIVNTDVALADFSKSYKELVKARAEFPTEPAPENLCK